MLILDPSIEEIKFRFGEHKKTHPKRQNLKHTLKETMKPNKQRNRGAAKTEFSFCWVEGLSRTTESRGAERTK